MEVESSEESLTYWLTAEELEAIPTAEYWNDQEREKQKEWAIESESDLKAIHYVRHQTNLEDSLLEAVNWVRDELGISLKGTGLDLAAGTCWASGLLLSRTPLGKALAVDISVHRLDIIAPMVLHQYGIEEKRVERIVGSFSTLKLPDESVDHVYMVQAYHHADSPAALIREAARVLKPGGVIIASGEHPITEEDIFRKRNRNWVKSIATLPVASSIASAMLGRKLSPPRKRFATAWDDLRSTDPLKGDREYTLEEAEHIFTSAGLTFHPQTVAAPDDDRMVKSEVNLIGVKNG